MLRKLEGALHGGLDGYAAHCPALASAVCEALLYA